MEYHAHIYWRNEEERSRAMEIRTYLERHEYQLGRVWDEPIGPHPLPMYQVVYTSKDKEFIEFFLEIHRAKMTILLHESINDDLRDHTEGARWLGKKLDLNLDIFRE